MKLRERITSPETVVDAQRRPTVARADRSHGRRELPLEAWETEEFACEIHAAVPLESDGRQAGVHANIEL